jgi:hypothetical protein
VKSEKIKYSRKENIARVLIPVISLLITFFILYQLFENISAINEGDHSDKRYILTVIESISLFIIPFIFNPKAVSKRINKRSKARKPVEKDILELKIQKLVKLDGHYTPAIIHKCPKCGFINVRNVNICYNCKYELKWEFKEPDSLTITINCPKCGFLLSRKTKVCHDCGYKIK